jgi:co-chaperonin GroES (HSP10)
MYTGKKTTEEKVATQLPQPKGYKILIGLPEVKTASIIGFVIKMGEDAYSDTERFPHGPYCEEGDFVIFRSYSGTRFKIHGKEFRLINDDTVEAVVDDPRGYTRI